ncbi:MAG: PAS domain S-box protein [Candidatus Hodarchaeales archaeon]
MPLESILTRKDVPEEVKSIIKNEIYHREFLEKEYSDLKSLFNHSPETSMLLDRDGRIITINRVGSDRLGKTKDDLKGDIIFDFFPPSVAKIRKSMIKEVIAKKESLRFSDSREDVAFENWIYPILDSQGEVERIAIFASDITNIIEANKALVESEEKYRTLVEKAKDGIVIIQDGIVKFVNKSLAEMSGRSIDEIIGTPFQQNIHPDALEKVSERYKDRLAGLSVPSIYETVLIRANGEKVIAELNAAIIPYQNRPADLVFVRDISERKQMMKELKESEERYRTLITTMGEGVWLTDSRDRTIFTNRALRKMLGYSEEELKDQIVTDFLAPESWKVFENVVKRRIDEKKRSSTYELTWIKKDGSSCITRVTGTLLLDEEGKLTSSFGIFTDITVEKHIEQSLQESEEKYRNLVERANDGITILQDRILIYANPSLSEILGYSIPELLGEPFTTFIHPDYLAEVDDYYTRRMVGEDVRPIYDSKFRKKDGSSIDVEVNAGIITYQGKPADLVFVRDISERKRTEELLKQIKMEEERYYAMLAHFINNDLQKIVNNLDYLLLEKEKFGKIKSEGIQRTINIATQSSRTIDTVNQIFDVLQSPSMNESKECVKLLEKVTSTINSIPNLKKSVEVDESSLDKLLICDKYFTSALSEILYFIQYSCEESLISHSPVQIEGSLLAAYYRIVIRDNCSPPISEEVSLRLSSKITDNWEYQGHYIGLALSSVIMQHYGGALKIFPIAEKGNEFQLQFPSILISQRSEKEEENTD